MNPLMEGFNEELEKLANKKAGWFTRKFDAIGTKLGDLIAQALNKNVIKTDMLDKKTGKLGDVITDKFKKNLSPVIDQKINEMVPKITEGINAGISKGLAYQLNAKNIALGAVGFTAGGAISGASGEVVREFMKKKRKEKEEEQKREEEKKMNMGPQTQPLYSRPRPQYDRFTYARR